MGRKTTNDAELTYCKLLERSLISIFVDAICTFLCEAAIIIFTIMIASHATLNKPARANPEYTRYTDAGT